jgi:L-alanine-DL-glutamate epimerase-like enolase superfamily enzyme
MEMRIGKRARTISRSARAAQAIGPDIGVIVDSNQQLTVQCAIKVGRAMEEFNLTWFEEPIPLSDHARRGGNRRGPLASDPHGAATIGAPTKSSSMLRLIQVPPR